MAGDHSSDPWEPANEAATAAGVELEPLETLEECDQILEVMGATWGQHQALPRELLRALQGSGNVPWGAFHHDRLVGYVLGWLGIDDAGPHVHSHMLAVLDDWQSQGVGYALKLAQRAWALDRGIRIVRWTFDPVNAANAHFNLAKLGAVADGFHRNHYGDMLDELNRGMRSDRLVARWELDRPAPGPAPEEGVIVLDRSGPEDLPEPTDVSSPSNGPVLLRIPEDYRALREADPELAARWRDRIADALEACLDAGLTATGFTANATYVLS